MTRCNKSSHNESRTGIEIAEMEVQTVRRNEPRYALRIPVIKQPGRFSKEMGSEWN
jgi:hypothetical protein